MSKTTAPASGTGQLMVGQVWNINLEFSGGFGNKSRRVSSIKIGEEQAGDGVLGFSGEVISEDREALVVQSKELSRLLLITGAAQADGLPKGFDFLGCMMQKTGNTYQGILYPLNQELVEQVSTAISLAGAEGLQNVFRFFAEGSGDLNLGTCTVALR